MDMQVKGASLDDIVIRRIKKEKSRFGYYRNVQYNTFLLILNIDISVDENCVDPGQLA